MLENFRADVLKINLKPFCKLISILLIIIIKMSTKSSFSNELLLLWKL